MVITIFDHFPAFERFFLFENSNIDMKTHLKKVIVGKMLNLPLLQISKQMKISNVAE